MTTEATFMELTMSTSCACGAMWHTRTVMRSRPLPELRRFKTCPICLPEPQGEADPRPLAGSSPVPEEDDDG